MAMSNADLEHREPKVLRWDAEQETVPEVSTGTRWWWAADLGTAPADAFTAPA